MAVLPLPLACGGAQRRAFAVLFSHVPAWRQLANEHRRGPVFLHPIAADYIMFGDAPAPASPLMLTASRIGERISELQSVLELTHRIITDKPV